MTAAADPIHRFEDSEAYERFMGAWSRAATPVFLEWLEAPPHARWLDLGCGTGVLSECVLDGACPSAIDAVDPAPGQVRHAARKLASRGVRWHVARAEALPFPDAAFHVVAAGLVLNFVQQRDRALDEMRRVARRAGIVCGFVWDFAQERSPSWPMRHALRAIGAAAPAVPGTEASGSEALRGYFERAGLARVSTCSFEVTASFPSFDEFWCAQTPSYSPTTRLIAAMSASGRDRLKEELQRALPVDNSGGISYAARANAIRAVNHPA